MKYLLLTFLLMFIGCDIQKDYLYREGNDYVQAKVCIEGHIYYLSGHSSLALKVSPSGRPISCKNKEK